MDEFVDFNFVLLDASQGPAQKAVVVERCPRRERVDVISRQFRDFLRQGDPADDSPRTMMLTHDFTPESASGEVEHQAAFRFIDGACSDIPRYDSVQGRLPLAG